MNFSILFLLLIVVIIATANLANGKHLQNSVRENQRKTMMISNVKSTQPNRRKTNLQMTSDVKNKFKNRIITTTQRYKSQTVYIIKPKVTKKTYYTNSCPKGLTRSADGRCVTEFTET